MRTEEMIAIVQHYINVRKNIEVKITIRGSRDLMLLTQAYTHAINWFRMNNLEIKMI